MTLSAQQLDEFIESGFTVVRRVIPHDFIERWWMPRREWLTANASDDRLARIGSHIYFPRMRTFKVREIAPSLVVAVQQLLGRDRLKTSDLEWGDGFVVAKPESPEENITWHKDGFFRHFLDSPEVGLVCLVLWTEATCQNGATALAENSVRAVASALKNHPEGCDPDFFETLLPGSWPSITADGAAGDVYLLHPFLLHARRPNKSINWRAISNPVVALREPLRFDTADPSPLERSILRALQLRQFSFNIAGERTGAGSKRADRLSESRSWIEQSILAWQ